MMMRRLLSVLMIVAMFAAACGSDDASEPAASSASEPNATSEESVDEAAADTADADTGEAADDTASADTDETSDTDETDQTDEAGDDSADDVGAASSGPVDGCPTVTLITHDSFFVSEGVFEAFTEETCIGVEQLSGGDAGQLVASAILTRDNPTADVLFGIDNTFLQRGLDADLFVPHAAAGLDTVDPALQLDPQQRVTPIDFGDVCANYWIDALPGATPVTLDDLLDPINADQFVTQNPETSSPGFAFLLATIATYGDDWEEFWQELVDNGVSITAGWEDAYYGEFIAGGGERSIVMSYASSPPAEFLFADPPVEMPPTGVLDDSCYRQIEFAGILAGTEQPEAAGLLIDFMLSPTFQEDIPLNMFVYPANGDAVLPEAFVEFGQLVDSPLSLDPAEIEANREDWTERWVEIVLG